MSSFDRLRAHHEMMMATMASLIERAKKTPSDASLLLSYCREYLIPHSEAEEATYYAAWGDVDFAKNMVREHKEIKHRLDTVDEAFLRGDLQAISSSVDEFTTLLKQHHDKEESTLMPQLKAKLSEQEIEILTEEARRIQAGKKISDLRALFEYDHKRIDLNISDLQSAVGQAGTGDEATTKRLYSKIRAQLLKHIELEETVLFPAYTDQVSHEKTGPIQVMIAEHREINSYISYPSDQLDMATLPNNLHKLIGLLAVHNKKEELILYPLINRTIQREKRENVYRECFDKFTEV